MTITGIEGQVRWGYLPALSFSGGRFESTDDGGTLTATLTHQDEFRVTQAPLVLTVPIGQHVLRWPVREWSCSGSALRVSVGPRER